MPATAEVEAEEEEATFVQTSGACRISRKRSW
jgi:hypothetical protein